jgi:cytochrome c oxidase subunit 2
MLANFALALAEPPPLKMPPSDSFWMPLQASTVAGDVDWLYSFLTWLSTICALGIFVAMIYFVVRFRATSRKANEKAPHTTEHNTTLEITWSVIPLVIVIAIFVWGFQGFMRLKTVPKNAIEIHVTAQKWKWIFEYPNGLTDDVLHVPKDKPVHVLISSVDVLHSLFIPVFRTKMDAVPGRYTDLWFQATKEGDFLIECAEYCGAPSQGSGQPGSYGHSGMLAHVVVHPEGGYEDWLDEQQQKLQNMPPTELGELLYSKQGCSACHTTTGAPLVGPTWKGLFGKSEALSAGPAVNVDENYLRESIVDPQAKIVAGFPSPSPMPTYQGKLSDKELNGLVEYIKSLK